MKKYESPYEFICKIEALVMLILIISSISVVIIEYIIK